MPTTNSALSREQLLESQMKHLSGRDLQLWMLGFLIFLVLVAGVIVLVLPNLFADIGTMRAEGRYLPQLFLGLIALVVLFNVYLMEQRRSLNIARQELVRQMLISEKNEELTLVDPLTQTFNRRYMERVLPKEVSRTHRRNSTLTVMMIDLDDFKLINDTLGHSAGDDLLVEAALLLQRTFRSSDTILRYGGDEFLVILPDTTEQQAQYAVERLLNEVVCWNAVARHEARMSLSCGAAQYRRGDDISKVLREADQQMYAHKGRHKNRPARILSPVS